MTALWILFSSFCSACILASIQCLRETLAFIDVAFVQFLFVLAVTVVVMLVRQVPFSTHVWHLHLLRSLIGVGVVITQIITAMNMPVAAAQTLQYTSPLFVAGFSAIASFRNGEHIDWRILASITAAFIGILVMFHPSERSSMPVSCISYLLPQIQLQLIQSAKRSRILLFRQSGSSIFSPGDSPCGTMPHIRSGRYQGQLP